MLPTANLGTSGAIDRLARDAGQTSLPGSELAATSLADRSANRYSL